MLSVRFYYILLRMGIPSLICFTGGLIWMMELSVKDSVSLAILLVVVLLICYWGAYGYCRWIKGLKKCFRFGGMIREEFFKFLSRAAFPVMILMLGLGMWLWGFHYAVILKFLLCYILLFIIEYNGAKALYRHFTLKSL